MHKISKWKNKGGEQKIDGGIILLVFLVFDTRKRRVEQIRSLSLQGNQIRGIIWMPRIGSFRSQMGPSYPIWDRLNDGHGQKGLHLRESS